MDACGGKSEWKNCNRQRNLLPRGNPCIQMKFSVPRALKSRQLFCGASRRKGRTKKLGINNEKMQVEWSRCKGWAERDAEQWICENLTRQPWADGHGLNDNWWTNRTMGLQWKNKGKSLEKFMKMWKYCEGSETLFKEYFTNKCIKFVR